MFDNYKKLLFHIEDSYKGDKEKKELSNNYYGYLLYRKISFYITPFFILLSIKANTVTFISFFFPFIILFSAFYCASEAYFYIFLFSVIYHILDYVDGNIARFLKTNNSLGQYLDSIVGNIYWTCLYISIGKIAQEQYIFNSSFENWGLLISVFLSFLDILSKQSRLYCRSHFKHITWNFVSKETEENKINRSAKKILVDIFVGLQLAIPYLTLFFGFIGLSIASFAYIIVYVILSFLLVQISIVKKLKTI